MRDAVVANERTGVSRGTSEAELVARARHDPAAFGELYDRHVHAIHSYVANRIGPGPAAEDLTGDVFVRALAALPRYRWQGVPFRHWLYRIAANLVRSYWRSRQEPLPLPEAPLADAAAPGPEEAVAELELRERLRQLVRALPDAQQEAVVLRFGQELPYADIALILDKSESAVRQLVFRALVALRRQMGGEARAGE